MSGVYKVPHHCATVFLSTRGENQLMALFRRAFGFFLATYSPKMEQREDATSPLSSTLCKYSSKHVHLSPNKPASRRNYG